MRFAATHLYVYSCVSSLRDRDRQNEKAVGAMIGIPITSLDDYCADRERICHPVIFFVVSPHLSLLERSVVALLFFI